MRDELSVIIDRINDPLLSDTEVISWASPVPVFGNLHNAKIATLGLNPSNREFVDVMGNELDGANRRFPTLNSLGIENWDAANEDHYELIWDSCSNYFMKNPYDGWFKKLDYIISGANASYYFPAQNACHLDLIPYATSAKWTELTPGQKSSLLQASGDILGLLLNISSVEYLILNGQTVVDNLEKICNVVLKRINIPEWTLQRKNSNGVLGYAYFGEIDTIGKYRLQRKITVLGYNHNLQSSYGVTSAVQTSIRKWIEKSINQIAYEA